MAPGRIAIAPEVCACLFDLPSLVEASSKSDEPSQGLAQAGNRSTLFRIIR
jgi:hypothetical protein